MKRELNGRRDYSSPEISELIRRYRASGLGVVGFAQQHGIPPGRMHYWVYQKSRNCQKKTSMSSASAPLFQEVKVGTMLSGVEGWAAEVSLSGGLAIRFSAVATPGWIGSVVQALQRPC
jgi:hypothetical protein